MYRGYLSLDGTEILNAARVKKYITTLLPGFDVKCDFTGLHDALGATGYNTPAIDAAPWYEPTQPQTARFYGFLPLGLAGATDSTRQVETTELTGNGSVHTSPRHGSREIQVKTLAVAADEEALAAGIAWLKDQLENADSAQDSTNAGVHCLDREATFFSALPVSRTASQLLRTFYRVEVIEGPLVTKEWPSRRGAAASVEFVLRAGVPWGFTEPVRVGSLDMDVSTTTHTDAAGEDCSASTDPYSGFINDPYFTAIKKPPLPPNIKPPNILTVSSWKRRVLTIPEELTKQAGRAVPVIKVLTGSNDLQQVRIRFYDDSGPLTGCGYAGEFMVSYLPVNASLTIDGIREEITVLLADGRRVPAGHLVYGADGKPLSFAEFSGHKGYTMTVDMMTGNTGLTVLLDVYVRD
jgi:hypothetical protein